MAHMPACSSRVMGGANDSRRTMCCVQSPSSRLPSTAHAVGSDRPRRDVLQLGLAVLAAPLFLPGRSGAVGFKKELKKRKLSDEDFAATAPNGLRYLDLEEGRGPPVEVGDAVTVHFDCLYKGVDAVSSRYARTLGGNRTVAEPFDFVAGGTVRAMAAKKINEGAGGLFAGGSGPKPPGALSLAVVGMKAGGKRLIKVDVVDLGYPQGNQEIPGGAPFELRVEVLAVSKAKATAAAG